MSIHWDLIGESTFESNVILGDSKSKEKCLVSWSIFGAPVLSGDYASTKVDYTVFYSDTNIHGSLPVEKDDASTILSDRNRAKDIIESVIENGSRLPKMQFER